MVSEGDAGGVRVVFLDDKDYERTFPTRMGPIGVLAEIEVHGDQLTLRDLSIFPTTTGERLPVGVREMLEILRAIEAEAVGEGFRACTVVAKRIFGAAPGRMIVTTRKLR